jgi:peptide/nickel transport system substrate-binding protein
MQRCRRLAAVTLGLGGLALLTACGAATTTSPGGSAGSAGGMLTIPFVADMSAPDPDVFYDVEGDEVTQSVYQGLVQYAPNSSTIVPELATSWNVSPDHRTYTFDLRQGVHFDDGALMTSADVVRSFKRRQALNLGSAYMVAGIASMTTPTPSTFVVHLTKPELPFLDYLASLWGPRVIGPTALVTNAGSDHSQTWLGTHGDGTGPYELTSFNRGTAYVLNAFPGYWGPQPHYTTVRLQIVPDINTQELGLKGGDFQMMLHGVPSSELPSLESNSNLSVATFPTQQTLTAYLNTHKGPFMSAAARAAVAKVIDPQTIVKEAYGPTATVPSGPYPPNVLTDQPKLDYGQGPPPGAPADGQGRKITIQYAADEVATLSRVSEILQVELSKLGYAVTIQQIPHAQIYGYEKNPATGPDILLLTNNPDAAAPNTWAGINWGTNGGTNLLSVTSPAIDSMLASALSQSTPDRADAIYRQIGQQIVDSHAFLFIATVKDTIVYSKALTNLVHVPLYPWMVDLASLKPAA